MIDDSN